VVDNEQAEVVRELHARYSRGAGLGELTTWLRAEGVTGARGKPWSRFGLAYYLRSGFAAGLLYVHNTDGHKDAQNRLCRNNRGSCANRIHLPGSHEPIITAQVWQQVQAEQARRSTVPVRSRVPVSKLAGIVYCAGCGRRMQLQASSGRPRHAYVCRSKRLTVDGCDSPAWVRRDLVETEVRAWLAGGIAAEVDKLVAAAPSPAARKSRRERLSRRVTEIDTELVRLLRMAFTLEMPESAVAMVRADLMAEQKAAQSELDRMPESDRPAAILGQVRGLLAVWDTAAPHEIASVVRDLLQVRITRPGVIELVPAWTV
jgi:hypothetical protein